MRGTCEQNGPQMTGKNRLLAGKYTGCPNYLGGPGTACRIFQGSLELLSKLFRVLYNFPSTLLMLVCVCVCLCVCVCVCVCVCIRVCVHVRVCEC